MMSNSRSLKVASSRTSRSTADTRTPTVLVLLAAYNGAQWIREQIYSILTQEHVVTSIIINDDGSTDETRALLQETFANNSRVTILPSASAFGSAGQNFFFLIRRTPAVNFDYVAFSDQDDLWFRRKLADAIAILRENSAVATSSATLARWPNGTTQLIALDRPATRIDYLFEGAGQGCTFLLDSEFYGKIREFLSEHKKLTESAHFHDWTIYALARSWDFRWVFNPNPSMIYRQHAANDTGARASVLGVQRRLAAIRGGWYSRQVSAIASICNQARPDNSVVAELLQIITSPRGLRRNFRLFLFCLSGGRRRRTDNLVLLFACIFGWI